MQLLGIFKEAYPDIDRIVELIQHDPSLTAEVLKRCNSAYFAGAQKVSDIFQAVMRVGFYEMYCVVLSTVGTRAMSLAKSGSGLDAQVMWEHAVITALAAGALAPHANEEEAVCFTAGLLHDIGKLVIVSAVPVEYAGILGRAGTHGAGLAETEKEVLGLTHADVGARLLSIWGFPQNVVLAVKYHHGSPSATASFEQLAACINLANTIGHLSIADGVPREFASQNEESMKVLKLAPKDLDDVLGKVGQGLKHAQELLRL
jgi:putative nucleotidyltransferase with HDIG domain